MPNGAADGEFAPLPGITAHNILAELLCMMDGRCAILESPVNLLSKRGVLNLNLPSILQRPHDPIQLLTLHSKTTATQTCTF